MTDDLGPTARALAQEPNHASAIFKLATVTGMGWEDIWLLLKSRLPPTITKEDVRRFVIPKLNRGV